MKQKKGTAQEILVSYDPVREELGQVIRSKKALRQQR
jgi:hypothetical protein